MTDLQVRAIGSVKNISGEEMYVSVWGDADATPDVPGDSGLPGISVGGWTFSQEGTEDLAKLIVAASWEAARIAAEGQPHVRP